MKPKIVKKAESKPKKDKSQPKRLKTFSSSQFSLWEEKGKPLQASATDLSTLKGDTANRRAQNNSAMSQYSTKVNVGKVTGKKKKKVPAKTKVRVKKIEQQQFEKAKYKQSNSQSEIIFSNDETKRETGISIKDVKYAHSINNYEHDSNLVLRVNIKKQYVRKVEAATKIQKVFRGYMTRKILTKYINDEEQKLRGRLMANSSSQFDEVRQNQTQRTFVDKEGQNLMSKLFENSGLRDGNNLNHTLRPRADNFQHSASNSDDEGSERSSSRQKSKKKEHRPRLAGRPQNWMEAGNNEEASEDEESEDDGSNMIYKRQNPIYSQEQISQYLESSEEDEENEEQLDGYEPEIIFETNEEYIQSRKSSLQNKNEPINKLSNKGIQEIGFLLNSEDKIRKELRLRDEPKTLQGPDVPLKSDRASQEVDLNKIKLESVKKQQSESIEVKETVNDISKKQKGNSDPISTEKKQERNEVMEVGLKEKMVKSPRRQTKYLDEQDEISNSSINSSKKSKSSSMGQKEIIMLREQECEKWEEVIRMVNQQIQKNSDSNGQMVSFMKNIMEFSQKNKQLLGSTRSVNSQSETFTEVKRESVSVGLPLHDENDKDHKNQESGTKFFKKKKPLKIDIIDSNFLKEQRESLISEKADNKMERVNFTFLDGPQFEKVNKKKQQKYSEDEPEQYHGFYRSQPNPNEQDKLKKIEYEESLEKSKTLKKFLASSIHVQDEAVYDILKLRQELLQKRQSEQLVKLNKQLNNKELSQEKFLAKLSNLTKKFLQEKETIDKAKEDIAKGYQAANNLVREYFFDVRRMGIKLAVSKSQDNLKYKFSQPAYFSSDIKIDELTPKSTPKSSKRVQIKEIFADHEISEEKSKEKLAPAHHHSNIESSEDSSIDFTEQELKRFRKAANYDLEFNDLNRNMTTISEEFIKQQRKCFQDEFDGAVTSFYESPENMKDAKAIMPQRQTYMLEQFKAPSSRTPPHVEAVVEHQLNTLIWQFASELMIRPEMSEKFVEKPTIIRPACITTEERMQFLRVLQENLPAKHILHMKLNQNITPLPGQILKCMRLDFSEEADEEEEDENYEEINRYEFVISQQACAKSVMAFKNSIDQLEQRKEIEDIKNMNQIGKQFKEHIGNCALAEKIERFIGQRDKFIKNKKQHTRELRWEVMNIQLHCIFDSWNEEIIQICSARAGFSGIGLNQLTLSMINHNKPVPESKSDTIVMEAKDKVVEILADDTDINAKILRENFHEMCETDSAWIFYADEALSYALELVYLVEEDIYSEVAREMRRIAVKSSLAL